MLWTAPRARLLPRLECIPVFSQPAPLNYISWLLVHQLFSEATAIHRLFLSPPLLVHTVHLTLRWFAKAHHCPQPETFYCLRWSPQPLKSHFSTKREFCQFNSLARLCLCFGQLWQCFAQSGLFHGWDQQWLEDFRQDRWWLHYGLAKSMVLYPRQAYLLLLDVI